MRWSCPHFFAGLSAASLTLFDLDRTFYVPRSAGKKWQLRGWWWGFVLLSGWLAALLCVVVFDLKFLSDWHPWLRGLAVGLSYLAIIRLKFSTFEMGGREVPLGFELFYEQAKGFFFKQINSIARNARYEETIAEAVRYTLDELVARARLFVEQDALLSPEDKEAALRWITSIEQDAASPEEQRKQTLANAILADELGRKNT